MGFFSRSIGNEKQKAVATELGGSAAKTGGITYDPELVDRLKREHEELARIFAAIKAATAECHFSQLPGLFADFKHAFLNHVGLENVKIYVYIQQDVELDAETASFVSGVRKDMNEIARLVMKFIDTHLANAPSPVSVMSFTSELDKIGAALQKRVEMEENRLYALYRP